MWRHAGLDYYAQVFPYLGRPPTHSPTLFDLQKLAVCPLDMSVFSEPISHLTYANYSWPVFTYRSRKLLHRYGHCLDRGDFVFPLNKLWICGLTDGIHRSIRIALEVGAHRKKSDISVDGQLWSRAFWFVSICIRGFN